MAILELVKTEWQSLKSRLCLLRQVSCYSGFCAMEVMTTHQLALRYIVSDAVCSGCLLYTSPQGARGSRITQHPKCSSLDSGLTRNSLSLSAPRDRRRHQTQHHPHAPDQTLAARNLIGMRLHLVHRQYLHSCHHYHHQHHHRCRRHYCSPHGSGQFSTIHHQRCHQRPCIRMRSAFTGVAVTSPRHLQPSILLLVVARLNDAWRTTAFVFKLVLEDQATAVPPRAASAGALVEGAAAAVVASGA